ncbi:MAG: lytic transglycosylase [Cytophagales bacterium CG18_big_fil_WC_8_21_14_2_50_42_9]|nr:MAG: lytic transglycosylase [Cytophagales bacterium CG18_big_fil_WC_8_21_14_2_50_42_9]
MKRHLKLLLTCFIFITAPLAAAIAQTNSQAGFEESFLSDSIFTVEPDTIPFTVFPIIVPLDSVPVIPDALVRDRLACLERTIPLHYNTYVQGFVNYFTIRNRKYIRRILEREQVYFPLFEKYLAKYDLPSELKYLSVVESALNPKAVSWAKAVGLWQFMAPTASDYRLKINEYLDERMDPEKSTEAACKFLKQLHKTFGSWEMALAAYNCGPGNVKKAIARSGGKKTFYEVFPYLPKETRSYVPSFAAIIYTMNHADSHEIIPDTMLFAVETDTILINQSLDLSKLALQLNLPAEEIQRLNPAVRKGYLPETIRNYPLKVPVPQREVLAYNRVAILDSCKLPIIAKPEPTIMLASSTTVNPAAPAPVVPAPSDSVKTDSIQKIEYIVAKGDYLYKIAQQHQVTPTQLKEWNNLKSGTLVLGQKIVVYTANPIVTADQAETVAVVETDKNQAEKITAAIHYPAKSGKTKKIAQDVKLIHAVQPGDTLWNISRKYNNIPVEQIKKMNKLKTNELKPGQKLVIS